MKNIDVEAVKVIASTISALRVRRNAFLEDLKNAGASQKDRLIRVEQERLARQQTKNIIDSLGDQVTVLNREDVFLSTHPDAYRLSGTIGRETSMNDLD